VPDPASRDGDRIVGLYDMLSHVDPSPIVELNRAVAMRDGSEASLALIDAILARGDLADYPFAMRHEPIFAADWGGRLLQTSADSHTSGAGTAVS